MSKQLSNQIINDNQNYDKGVNKKKTSKLVRFLLILMVIAIIGIGQFIFEYIDTFVKRSNSLASMHVNVIFITLPKLEHLSRTPLTDCSNGTDCFGKIGHKFHIDSQYDVVSVQLEQIATLNKQITSNKEKHKEDPSLTEQRNKIIAQINPQVEILIDSAKKASEFRQTDKRFRTYLFMLSFTLPLFLLSFFLYFRFKKKDSSNVSVWVAFLAAFSLLFLQTIMRFFVVLKEIFSSLPISIGIMNSGFLIISIILIILVLAYIMYIIKRDLFHIQVNLRDFLKPNKKKLIITVTFLSIGFFLMSGAALIGKYIGDYPASSSINSFLIGSGFMIGLITMVLPAWLMYALTGIAPPLSFGGSNIHFLYFDGINLTTLIYLFIFWGGLMYIATCLFTRARNKNHS